jgi:ABC-2 type transport system permease protein
MHPRLALAITRKDLRDALQNMYMLFAIVLPVGMSILFKLIFPSDSGLGSGGLLSIAVYDPEGSQYIQKILATGQFSAFFVASPDEVRREVEKGKQGGLVLTSTFDEDVAAGRSPEIQVYVNSSTGGLGRAAFTQIVQSSIWSMASQAPPARAIYIDTNEQGATKGGLASLNLSSYYLLLFLVMSVTMVGVFVVPYLLVEEKEKGTLKAVLVSPASYADVVMGKGATGLFYALTVSMILLALNSGFTGNIPLVMAAVLVGAVFLVQVGLLMGAAFKTVTQVNSWSSVIMLALLLPAMLGGNLFSMPQPVEMVMRLLPTYYMADAITGGLANQATWQQAFLDLAVLAACAAIAFAGVVYFLKRERQ